MFECFAKENVDVLACSKCTYLDSTCQVLASLTFNIADMTRQTDDFVRWNASNIDLHPIPYNNQSLYFLIYHKTNLTFFCLRFFTNNDTFNKIVSFF